MEVLSSRQLPDFALTLNYLPAGSAAAAAAGGGSGSPSAAPELWVVSCRGGGVYAYKLEDQGKAFQACCRPLAWAALQLPNLAIGQGWEQ